MATTVIEVGVDIPNATLMIVLDADRFGVSQLHQLRGRVGRGSHAGLCLLVTESPEGTDARERLAAVAATSDGFELSRYDLAARREGDVLGAAQSGSRRSLRLLSVLDHEDVILRAREEATRLVDADPELSGHPVLAGRWPGSSTPSTRSTWRRREAEASRTARGLRRAGALRFRPGPGPPTQGTSWLPTQAGSRPHHRGRTAW